MQKGCNKDWKISRRKKNKSLITVQKSKNNHLSKFNKPNQINNQAFKIKKKKNKCKRD